MNAGGLSEGVLESELFGHVKGAFTDARADRVGRFELADGGTLFLDEIGNAPPSLQARLLRLLETGEFERVGSSRTLRANVRVISATNADLDAEVATGRFRQDLALPAEHDRDPHPAAPGTEGGHRSPRGGLSRAARGALQKGHRRIRGRGPRQLEQHPWPGNVRELDHAVERAVLMATRYPHRRSRTSSSPRGTQPSRASTS